MLNFYGNICIEYVQGAFPVGRCIMIWGPRKLGKETKIYSSFVHSVGKYLLKGKNSYFIVDTLMARPVRETDFHCKSNLTSKYKDMHMVPITIQ